MASSIVLGTQLYVGAHLTGAIRALCRESVKRRNYGLFVVVKSSNVPPENFNTRPKESNVPPLNNDFESNVPQLFILDSHTFVVKSALLRLRALFGGTFGQNMVGGGTETF